MKRLKVFLAVGLFLGALSIEGCKKAETDNPLPPSESTIAEPAANQTVSFKGVSFSYNPQIFGKVKFEEVGEHTLENETDKPDFVAPQHIAFTFELSSPFTAASVAVFPVEDFPRMYAVNKASVKAVEEEISNLKKVLQDKNFRVEKQIPYIPFVDASQTFQAKVKHLSFQNGKGILFLTHWDIEIDLIRNDRLEYVFEGLTSDGKYYVLAEMPVSIDFLEKDSKTEFGYELSDYATAEAYEDKVKMKQHEEYISKVAERLETSPPEKFQPNPKYFEEIISSLKIEK